MYLIAALKAGRPRHDAAMCSVSSEGLPVALSRGRRQERKKKEVKFKLLGMKAGRRSVKAVGKFIPIPCLQYLNLKMARYECPTTCILFLFLMFE